MAGRTARGVALCCLITSPLTLAEAPPDLAFLEFLGEWGDSEASTLLDKELASAKVSDSTVAETPEADDE